MRNRGIERETLIWNNAGNGSGSWTIHTHSSLFGMVQVDIPAKRKTGSLTHCQVRCLEMLRTFPSTMRVSTANALGNYAKRVSGEDNAPDLNFVCDNASVPYLDESDTPYIFLNVSSDVDEEHGVCFLVRDGELVGCFPGDVSLEFFGWDSTEELDALTDEFG